MTAPTERQIGFAEGVLDRRLSEYDKHFADINGSVAATAAELSKLVRSVDALAAAQREATTLAAAVAAALEKKETSAAGNQLTNRGVIAWAAGLIVTAFAVVASIKAWFGYP